MKTPADHAYDRVCRLLDYALAEVRKPDGDRDAVVLLMAEAEVATTALRAVMEAQRKAKAKP